MDTFTCGDHEASQDFYNRNKATIEASTKTHHLCFEMIRMAHAERDALEKTVVWLLAASCLKEFDEILLLACNAFGTGATKLMRSFYERTVIMSYLAQIRVRCRSSWIIRPYTGISYWSRLKKFIRG